MTITQEDLFGATAPILVNKPTPYRLLFRTHSPDTSRTAAKKLDSTRLEQMVLDAIVHSGARGMTQDELRDRFPDFSYSSITARPAALKRKGLIVDSGERRPGHSGRGQAVLKAVTT
jgi:hypothetical protein